MTPKISTYMNGKLTQVALPTHNLYYSYETLVGFEKDGRKYVHTNDWGPTTGKHLNYIDGGNKKDRLDDGEFKRIYDELIESREAV